MVSVYMIYIRYIIQLYSSSVLQVNLKTKYVF